MKSGRGSRRRRRRRRCHRRRQAQQRHVDRPARRAAGRRQKMGAHLEGKSREERGTRGRIPFERERTSDLQERRMSVWRFFSFSPLASPSLVDLLSPCSLSPSSRSRFSIDPRHHTPPHIAGFAQSPPCCLYKQLKTNERIKENDDNWGNCFFCLLGKQTGGKNEG